MGSSQRSLATETLRHREFVFSDQKNLCVSVSPWLIRLCALCLFCVVVSGCRQDMHDQPKYVPLRQSAFFGDARSARPVVEGTVARGQLNEDELLYTGKVKGEDAAVFPMRVDAAVMARGQQRFNIYCAPCHGRTGQGDGMVVRRGYRRPPSMHQDRLRSAPAGHFFDVMTNGFGAMPDYAAQMQLSEHAALTDVPAADRSRIQ